MVAKDPDREIDPATGVYVETAAAVVIITSDGDSAEAEAADVTAPHVLFGSRNTARGGWGGIDTSVTSINGQSAQMVGTDGWLPWRLHHGPSLHNRPRWNRDRLVRLGR